MQRHEKQQLKIAKKYLESKGIRSEIKGFKLSINGKLCDIDDALSLVTQNPMPTVDNEDKSTAENLEILTPRRKRVRDEENKSLTRMGIRKLGQSDLPSIRKFMISNGPGRNETA